ncbi:MAG: hypothetical protein A3A86_03810 [Elusimicrobia bacterium RIFCSPLOWO2_01_FULL_60_11]|nr:MAG: hypothetical protein A3A86_03810 [Elusimicrobia bacterium RIFCSPLOWO2_01_FULL_60_11]
MNDRAWLIEEDLYSPEKELYWETVFALSNGYMASRGAIEENHFRPEVKSYFGTYAAGVFDKYNKEYQAIVNLPDFFNTDVRVNGEPVRMKRGQIENYSRSLDMRGGFLRRKFDFVSAGKGHKTRFEVTRFISKADPHLAVLHYAVEPLNYDGEIRFDNVLDGNITNIDFHVSGYQLRDEKYHFIDDDHEVRENKDGGGLLVRTKVTKHRVCEVIRCELREDGALKEPKTSNTVKKRFLSHGASFPVRRGKRYSYLKLVSVRTSRDGGADLFLACNSHSAKASQKGYERLLSEHKAAWEDAWKSADIVIEGDERDQRNVRFNIFHLIQMGNKNDPRVNVGSRGLTSEMHYGNCFWDTELFIMPFFIYSDPAAARALVQYRYLTLPAAREKAKKLLFKGALYPWMSSWPGHEQADYWEYANIAVHIVSDVIYGLMNYYRATGDDKFMLECGLEMLVETSRFWESRLTWSETRKKYVMNVVKGPNEYAITNNNTYTNWGCRSNLTEAVRMLAWAKKRHPKEYKALAKKSGLKDKEPASWTKIAKAIFINYDKSRDLYIEDDHILEKEPVDIKELKPGKVITTELGFTWDTFLRLKIVKQADVLLLMTLYRPEFTERQLRNAWKFYEPLTLHDSSLSYNTHCIVANELGDVKKSDGYFQQTARLDLEDVMENVFLGIHAANAGGAWQCVVNGFCGMRMAENHLEFSPNLPARYKSVRFRVAYRKNQYEVLCEKKKVSIHLVRGENPSLKIKGNRIET